ncbi:MAG: tRNA modification GTPase [Planctomycetota bacterium]|jgi:tRNA modification GTPase
MYGLNDTIVAVSSPTSDNRVIVRITGPDTIEICSQVFSRPIADERSSLVSGSVALNDELEIDAQLYLFLASRSYTGEDVVEIHIHTNSAVTEALIGNLLERGLRMAEPGEFTARAYLNGKIDLTQAEAVNEIVVSANEYQLAAAEKLLDGRLAETIAELRDSLMDCLGLIEAGLDFSGEDIEFIARPQAVERLAAIKDQLEQLLSGSIGLESLVDLPAVGIAGAPNAGKSSLLNKLLGKERSIVSPRHKTTRDVLTGVCTLAHCRCVLSDCAGLVIGADNILDELAQQAAIEGLRNSAVVIFCADVSKTEWVRDAAIRKLIEPKVLVPVATKCDLLPEQVLPDRLAELNELFAAEFLPVSAETGAGIELLRNTIDSKLTEKFEIPRASAVALTARHRHAVTEAIENISESIDELKAGNDEVTAMMLRSAYQAVSGIDSSASAHLDEQVLKQIFSRFCIGK